MQATTTAFLEALRKGQRRQTTVTYTVPGGQPVAVTMKAGQVMLDESNRIRRRANLTVFGSTADYLAMMTPGCRFRIRHGLILNSGQSNTLVDFPVFTGEVNSGRQALGGDSGEIQLPLVDMAQWLTRAKFLVPFTLAAGVSRVAAISAIVTSAMPGTIINNTSTDLGTLGADKVWTGSRTDAISGLNSDGGTESFFAPDGSYVIRDQISLSSLPVWTVRGLLKPGGERARPMDQLWNTVVVKPTATDGSQTWEQQIVQIVDPLSDRHPSKIGVVPYEMSAPTLASATTARIAGTTRLNRLLGTADALSFDMIGNPALEGGDVLRIIVPATGQEPANIYTHAVSSYTLDMHTGNMRLGTRSQEVDAA